jgi:hypothetical protein
MGGDSSEVGQGDEDEGADESADASEPKTKRKGGGEAMGGGGGGGGGGRGQRLKGEAARWNSRGFGFIKPAVLHFRFSKVSTTAFWWLYMVIIQGTEFWDFSFGHRAVARTFSATPLLSRTATVLAKATRLSICRSMTRARASTGQPKSPEDARRRFV